MDRSQQYPEVTEWLRQQGHTEVQISKILERVHQYDKEMHADSIMQSIEDGSFDIEAVVREALSELDDSSS